MQLLLCTTAETKTGVLLIEVFKTPFKQQNDGQLGQFRVAIFL
jgi:hypothetical protein